MSWNKLKELPLRAADTFDLPADVLSSLPHIELLGDQELVMNSHQGILAYAPEGIDINAGALILRVKGEGLALMAMTGDELRIRGKIAAVELVR